MNKTRFERKMVVTVVAELVVEMDGGELEGRVERGSRWILFSSFQLLLKVTSIDHWIQSRIHDQRDQMEGRRVGDRCKGGR
ncbi:hypothetical protein K1719_008540 [Acacia pycnantha]|nr:hypothetical protein K1719_008540 [Acacia pycnantha]